MWKPRLYPLSFGSKIPNLLVTTQTFCFVHLCISIYCVCILKVFAWLSSVSQASDMWICGLTAEEFITDNYVRMCWERNKPRTVWAGRCCAAAYTVPHAPCTPASHTTAPTGPLQSWKGQKNKKKHWRANTSFVLYSSHHRLHYSSFIPHADRSHIYTKTF